MAQNENGSLIMKRSLEDQIARGIEMFRCGKSIPLKVAGIQSIEQGSPSRAFPLDRITRDFGSPAEFVRGLRSAIPILTKLRAVGEELLAEGRIDGSAKDNLPELTLAYLLEKYAADKQGGDR